MISYYLEDIAYIGMIVYGFGVEIWIVFVFIRRISDTVIFFSNKPLLI